MGYVQTGLRGFAKKEKSEITMEVGGWVGPGLTRNFSFVENRPKIALNQLGVVYHVYSVCIYIAKSGSLL